MHVLHLHLYVAYFPAEPIQVRVVHLHVLAAAVQPSRLCIGMWCPYHVMHSYQHYGK